MRTSSAVETRSTRSADRSTPTKIIVIGLIGLLLICFYVAVVRFSVNVPIVDDFMYVFTLTRLLDPAATWQKIVLLIIEQHNDHRILLSRLAFLTTYAFEGHLNFQTLIIVASLSVAGMVWLIGRLFRRAQLSSWAILPVAFLLFQPSYHANVWWALSIWQHTVTLFLYILLFYLVLKATGRYQVSAWLLGAVLVFSNSNGIVAWFTVVLLLAVNRRWKQAGIWAVSGIILAVLYYNLGYDFRSQGSFQVIIQHPVWVFKSVVSFLGGAVYLNGWRWLGIPNLWLVLGTGVSVMVIVILAWWRMFFDRVRPSVPFQVFAALALVLCGTAGAASLTRSDGHFSVIDRYQVYSVLCVISAYALALLTVKGRWNQSLVVGMNVVGAWFCLVAWQLYPPILAEKRQQLISQTYSLEHYNKSVVDNLFLLDPYWQGLWKQAVTKGQYQFPNTELSGVEPVLRQKAGGYVATSFNVKDTVVNELSVDHDLAMVENKTLPTPDYMLLQSTAETHILPARTLTAEQPFRASGPPIGVKTTFYPQALTPGNYRIGWLNVDGDKPVAEWTKQFYVKGADDASKPFR
ncbi:hypothetical protein ACFSUS_23930 [Spirosoma soli]|uniref:Glycosyltransferase RgtA/B/C/D-like domain-containing protein n=1 Tax=Spirosoma soli TaxID=1770529 RepID=A0ABW5M9J7_9BACT